MIPGTQPQTPAPRPARRRNPRAINSCLECRERKSKCSRNYPCESCVAYGRECVFIKDNEIERNKSIPHASTSPQFLAQDSQPSRSHRESDQEGTPPRDFEWEAYQQDVVPERDLYASLAADTREATPHDDREEDESIGLALRFGRMIITHRVEGLSVAHFAKDLGRVLSFNKQPSNQQDHAPTPAPFYTTLEDAGGSKLLDGRPLTATRFRGTLNISRAESDLLYDQYLHAVHPIVHVIHMPSHKRILDEYWSNHASGRHNTEAAAALIACVGYAAGVSIPALQSMAQFRVTQDELARRLQEGAEDALRAANCLSSSSVTTLQALTIYLIVQCRSEVLRSHAALVGALIRLGQSIGLHRTYSITALTPLQRHVRSLLWYHICILDVKTAEAVGVQPLIRADDFDIQLPLNMDDAFFDVPDWQPISVRSWTDMTFTLMRFQCHELHRLIFRGTIEVAQKNITLHQLKSQVEAQKTKIQQQWLPLLDQTVPLQKYAGLVMKILMARSDLMLLIGLLPKTTRTESESKLRDILIKPALLTLEIGATLETSPAHSAFAWYASAYQSYLDIPFLIIELYKDPTLPDAKRISTMIDHVFGHCFGVSLHQRCTDLLHSLKSSLEDFHVLKHMKALPVDPVPENDNYQKDIMIQWGEEARPSGSDLDSLLNTYPTGFDMSGPPSATEPMDGIFMPVDNTANFGQTQGGEWIGQSSNVQWPRQQFDFLP